MLASVYVLMGLHFAHWKISGKTLAPLELNEVMHTLELGVITAGFLFMVTVVLATAVVGRFFCSWGRHILALEDLCAWILGKLGIRPTPVRSRVLLFVPPGAMLYMFAWPQVSRLLAGRDHPGLRIVGDGEGWASFATTDYWRNLPGPAVALLTFATCGFMLVYLLGSRSFCTYGCPYGVVFGLADRLAPGRLRLQGDCAQCGTCTAVCQSGVRVHEEVAEHGMVVDPACLKDLDCVEACPDRVLGFGFGRPSFGRSVGGVARRRRAYDFTAFEEALLGLTFLATLFVFRGLYGSVPFLMTLGLGGAAAFLAVGSWRFLRQAEAKVGRFRLKLAGRATAGGRVFAVGALGAAGLFGHSAFIRYHEVGGDRGFEELRSAVGTSSELRDDGLFERTLGHLRARERWGLVRPLALDQQLASLLLWSSSPEEAEEPLRRILAHDPEETEARLRLAQLLAARGRPDEAAGQARAILALERRPERAPHRSGARHVLAALRARSGDLPGAIAELRLLLEEDEHDLRAREILAKLLSRSAELQPTNH